MLIGLCKYGTGKVLNALSFLLNLGKYAVKLSGEAFSIITTTLTQNKTYKKLGTKDLNFSHTSNIIDNVTKSERY